VAKRSVASVKDRLPAAQVFLTTPFKSDDLSVDTDGVLRNAELLVAAGARVLVSTPGTGEFSSLTVHERVEVAATLLQGIGTEILVIPTVGGCEDEASSAIEQLEREGAEAFLVRPVPGSSSDSDIASYFGAIASKMGAVLIPEVVGNPSFDLLRTLCSLPNVIAVKWSGRDVGYFRDIIHRLAEFEVSWICGLGEMYAPFYSLAGACGYTSGLMNLVPRLSLELQRLLAERDFSSSMRILADVAPLNGLRTRRGGANSICALKKGLDLLGMVGGTARPPHGELCMEDRDELSAILAKMAAQGYCAQPRGAR